MSTISLPQQNEVYNSQEVVIVGFGTTTHRSQIVQGKKREAKANSELQTTKRCLLTSQECSTRVTKYGRDHFSEKRMLCAEVFYNRRKKNFFR